MVQGGEGEGAAGAAGEEPVRLYVGGLPPACQEADLRAQFERFGTLKQAAVMKDTTGGCTGAGFVIFERRADAELAIDELDGKASLEGSDKKLEVRALLLLGADPDRVAGHGAAS